MALPFTLKKDVKAKEELWKLKYFTMQKSNLQINPLKKIQNPSRYHNSRTVSTQAKISSCKNPHIKIDLLLTRGQNPLLATTLYNESKHNILALVGKANKSTTVTYFMFSYSRPQYLLTSCLVSSSGPQVHFLRALAGL